MRVIIICILHVCMLAVSTAQNNILKQKLEQFVTTKKADIGISVEVIETGEKTSLNAEKRYPMQSVYKFPLAIAVLNAVDKNVLSLQKKIHVKKSDLLPETWSPLREKFPKGNIDVTLEELLEYSVAKSDNNACDILFRVMGGPKKVDTYIKSLGVQEINMAATEREMTENPALMFKNYSTPHAMTELLKGLYYAKYLSVVSNTLLMKMMTVSENSPNRIKALLPKDAVVAHKTGTSGTNREGVRGALNDVGIITLPNGRHVVLTVFVSNDKQKYSDGERTVAEIAKIIWDYYVH